MKLPDFFGFLAGLAYLAGSVVCHQLPERSFFTAGMQWPVCARCAGIYLGVAVGFAAWWMLRRWISPRPGGRAWLTMLAVVATPTAASWVGGVLGFWDGTNGIRFALAAPLGLTVGVIAAAVTAKDLR
ncbi:MAG: DUF2085 domain-containing protein [Acidobacteriota bacterium]|nr:DUF2085 domain-containing protein [Acidobacteriota bacterium]